jgi:predicted metal-dependent hydrolase
MYLEIDEKTYFIHLKADIVSIILKNIEQQVIHLYVPARLPHENLVIYIKKELPKVLKAYKKLEISAITELFVFDRTYPVKVDETSTAYLKNNIIYASACNFATTRNIDFLKYSLLINFINSKMSYIEEDLKLILPVINLKKLKTKYYTICHTKEYITYSKTLIDKSQDFITYVVILAIVNYVRCSEEQVNDLISKYVSNAKHCEKVYKYEQ